jgi:hypothetical protein
MPFVGALRFLVLPQRMARLVLFGALYHRARSPAMPRRGACLGYSRTELIVRVVSTLVLFSGALTPPIHFPNWGIRAILGLHRSLATLGDSRSFR